MAKMNENMLSLSEMQQKELKTAVLSFQMEKIVVDAKQNKSIERDHWLLKIKLLFLPKWVSLYCL